MQPWFSLVCALCQTSLPAPGGGAPPSALTWSPAPTSTASYATVPTRAPASVPPAAAASLGEYWSLPHGRTLRVNLTLSPSRCALLVSLTF